MYSKIAINNVKKSFKDYAIYFLTLTFAVCIFYSFNSILSQKAMMELNESSASIVDQLHGILTGVSIFVSVILGGLIVYANNFLIKKRKKELGIYMTLGMAKGKISKIILFETVIIGIVSLVVGILLGIIASQGLSLFVIKLFDAPMIKYEFAISISAIGKTLLCFGIMFALVVIFNIKVISKYKLIDMLNAHKTSEKNKVRNKTVAMFIFILSVIFLGGAYWLIYTVGLRPGNPMFWMSVVFGIIGTLLWFISLSSFLLLIAQKSQKIYFKRLNIFVLSQINSKINTNFLSMTVICLMLFLTLGILSTGLSLKNSIEAQNAKMAPFDTSAYTYVDEKNPIKIEEALKDLNFKFNEYEKHVFFNRYSVSTDLFEKLASKINIKNLPPQGYGNGLEAIKISDFNNILKLQGKQPIKLDNNEVLLQSNGKIKENDLDKLNKSDLEFMINNKTYYLSKKINTDFIITGGMGPSYMLVIPDDVNAQIISSNVNVNFTGDEKKESVEKFNKLFDDVLSGKARHDTFIMGMTKERMYESNNALSGTILFIGIYLGIIFLISSAAVLALQQLSEASDSKDRYDSLRKIGATEKMINKTIFVQTLVYYGLPLTLAIVHAIVGIDVINDFVKTVGETNIVFSSLITTLILLIIYGGYFYITYIGYKNMIKKK